MWNLETGFRQMVLWASSAPPLSHTQGGHSVYAMHSGTIDSSGFLLAGGTDMRLRYWNLRIPNESYVALPAANDVIPTNSLAYELVFGHIICVLIFLPNRQIYNVNRHFC